MSTAKDALPLCTCNQGGYFFALIAAMYKRLAANGTPKGIRKECDIINDIAFGNYIFTSFKGYCSLSRTMILYLLSYSFAATVAISFA
jgi:hypothetical protein